MSPLNGHEYGVQLVSNFVFLQRQGSTSLGDPKLQLTDLCLFLPQPQWKLVLKPEIPTRFLPTEHGLGGAIEALIGTLRVRRISVHELVTKSV